VALVRSNRTTRPRRGVAATELAALLPLLIFLTLLAVDFGRVFFYSTTLASCARNGAAYLSDEYARKESPYGPNNVSGAALADAPDLMGDPANLPTVDHTTGTDSEGREYVQVTVRYTFRSITRFPGIPTAFTVSRTVRMAKTPPEY
jgi:Flp pilus assembly protein TadG